MIIKRKLTGNDLYFLSSLPSLEDEIIIPRIPINILTKNKFEDYKTPRICLYPTIDKALLSLSDQNLEGKEFYVYKPLSLYKSSLIIPSISQAPKSQLTNEFWYLRNLRLKFITKIKVEKRGDTKFIYHYGPRSTTGEIYDWKWKEILEPWEKSKL